MTTLPTETASPDAAAPVQTVALVSLGCPKNLVDSEKMLGLLAEAGLIPIAEEGQAEAIIINTCGFLEASKDESVEEIRKAVARKAEGTCRRVVVAGCLTQRHRAKLLEWCPGIDAMIGVFDRDRVVEAVRGWGKDRNGKRRAGKDAAVELPVYSSIAANATVARRQRGMEELGGAGYFESDAARLRLTPRHYAYLRISEGCNQNCAFCTIPSIRGKMRSKPLEAILAEARELFDDGAFELNLIGQDTTSYGLDIGYAPGLVGMLSALDRLASERGGAWLRLMYAYPSCFTDKMIDAIASLANVVRYIDMPLQHIHDDVLTRMKRHTSRRLIETLLEKLRTRAPGMAIRTTFISGFPGETDEAHEELVRFVKEFGFDAMGVFPYSPEPGTPAATWHAKGQAISPQVIEERIDELMTAQQEVVFVRHERMAEQGAACEVMIDSSAEVEGKATTGVTRGGRLYVGRSRGQAPDIDGRTYVMSGERLSPGEVVACRVTGWDGYDLVAQPVGELQRGRSLKVLR